MAYVVGLMSGTSLDGVDVALVKIDGCGMKTKVELIEFMSFPYSKDIKKEIHDSFSIETSNSALICSLNFKLGEILQLLLPMFVKRQSLPWKTLMSSDHMDKPFIISPIKQKA